MPRPVAVHGDTPETRAAARRQRTRTRRAAYYVQLMDEAPQGVARLIHACDYLRAAAKDWPTAEVERIAFEVTRMADELNGISDDSGK